MTTDFDWHIHYFNSYHACKAMMMAHRDDTLIIPFQPLFIQQYPSILPMSYFLNDGTDQEVIRFKLQQTVFNCLKKNAPEAFKSEALSAISNDICQALVLCNDPVNTLDWIELALSEIKRSNQYVLVKRGIENRIKIAAQWIQYHYKQIIFFGTDDDQMQLVNQLLQNIGPTMHVHWALPATETRSMVQPMGASFNGWESVQSRRIISKSVREYTSITQECNELGQMIQANKGQSIAIIAPNKRYELECRQMAHGLGLNISFQNHNRLLDTHVGQFWYAVSLWVTHHDLESFINLLHQPNIQLGHTELIKKARNIEMNERIMRKGGISHQTIQHLYDEEDASDPCLDKLIQFNQGESDVSKWQDVHRMVAASFSIDDTHYYDFLCTEHIGRALTLCESHGFEVSAWLGYMLTHSSAPTILDQDQTIVCIPPEHAFKYPNHALYVCGVDHSNWKVGQPSGQYLTMDDCKDKSFDATLRKNLCHWILESENTVFISYTNQSDGRQPMPSTIELSNMTSVAPVALSNKASYRRHRVEVPREIESPRKVSASAIEAYQQCPYAYFLKYVVKLEAVTPMSEYQVFGTLFHKIVEHMASDSGRTVADIKQELFERFNALMAHVIDSKLDSTEWDLDALATFFESDTSQQRQAEVSDTISINNVTIEGRMDIIRWFNDCVEVIDFKTGAPPTLPDIKRLHYLQLGIYGLMVGSDQIKGSILSKNNTYRTFISTDETGGSVCWNEYRGQLMERLGQLVNNQRENRYAVSDHCVTAAHHAKACRTCNYYSVCYSRERHQR